MSAILSTLDALIKTRAEEIERWFDDAYRLREVPIYSSVDIRHSGFKIAPVDTNLFPAGFNNLTANGRARAAAALTRYLARLDTPPKRVMVMAESHSRNQGYTDNLHALLAVLHASGLEVAVGRFDLAQDARELLTSSGGESLEALPIRLDANATLVAGDSFVPDMIIVNHDLSSGCPQILCDATQPVFPPPGMGWYRRRKSVHFTAYNQVASEFSRAFGIDSWLFSTIIHHCGRIDFKERKGLECVALGVDKTIHAIRARYTAHGIEREPYVFIKADSGTYGMGIMTARSGAEAFEMNKKTRNKMHVIKEGMQSSEVIIQEGVPTIDTLAGEVAEPMVYLMAGVPVGNIWRINAQRGDEANLNAAGMRFEPFDDIGGQGETYPAFNLIARLATMAAAYEHYDQEACR